MERISIHCFYHFRERETWLNRLHTMPHLVRIVLVQVVQRWPMRSTRDPLRSAAGDLVAPVSPARCLRPRKQRRRVRASRGVGQAANAKLAKPVVTSKNVTGTEQSTTATCGEQAQAQIAKRLSAWRKSYI